jgi:HK97 family phage major capsid protein
MSSNVVHAAPSALACGRYIKAIGMGRGDPIGAQAYAEGQHAVWRNTPEVGLALKAAVAAMQTTDPGGLAAARSAINALILPLIRANTLVDRMNTRRTPLNIAVPAFSGDATGHLVGEGLAKPLSKFSLELLTVTPRKIEASIVINNELLRFSDPTTESALASELAKAVVTRMDLVFADPNVGGSIANGATTISSSGGTVAQLDADFRAMLDALAASGDTALTNAVWIMSSKTAIWLATLRTTNGPLAYPLVTAKGGTLAGLPVLTTGALVATGSPSESAILLADPQQILFGDAGEASVTVARNAMVELDDAPAGGAGAVQISLFQADRVALRGERWCGWARQSTSSVIVLDDIQFAA